MNKPTKKRQSFVRIAKADDPIYKEGWTITTRAWGRLPKSDSQLAEAAREASKNTGRIDDGSYMGRTTTGNPRVGTTDQTAGSQR